MSPTRQRVSSASSPTDRKYAASVLRPYAASGRDHRRQRMVSISQWHAASACAASPALNSANELVHRFLLIGSRRPHAAPPSIAAAPTANSAAVRRLPPPAFSQTPANTPASAVAIAGSVLSSPSGS